MRRADSALDIALRVTVIVATVIAAASLSVFGGHIPHRWTAPFLIGLGLGFGLPSLGFGMLYLPGPYSAPLKPAGLPALAAWWAPGSLVLGAFFAWLGLR